MISFVGSQWKKYAKSSSISAYQQHVSTQQWRNRYDTIFTQPCKPTSTHLGGCLVWENVGGRREIYLALTSSLRKKFSFTLGEDYVSQHNKWSKYATSFHHLIPLSDQSKWIRTVNGDMVHFEQQLSPFSAHIDVCYCSLKSLQLR